jgi:hypothetical protein
VVWTEACYRSRGSPYGNCGQSASRVGFAPNTSSYCFNSVSTNTSNKNSGVPRNFFRGGGGGFKQFKLRTEDTERGSGGRSPLVTVSGGSCNLVQQISFYIVNFFNFWYFRLFMMTTNLFVIVNVKQLRTEGVLEFYCLIPNVLGCCCPKFSNF